jgi:hypothetical protein
LGLILKHLQVFEGNVFTGLDVLKTDQTQAITVALVHLTLDELKGVHKDVNKPFKDSISREIGCLKTFKNHALNT